MTTTKYGRYSPTQIHETQLSIRKQIFFLLLYVDPETSGEYPDANVADAISNLQYRLNGLNSTLLEPPEIIETMSLLEAALDEYKNDSFSWNRYRNKLL